MASGDSSARGRQTANLLRGHSPDPAVAARQRANLTPGRKDLHGAYSAALLGPLAEQHEAELAADYPRMRSPPPCAARGSLGAGRAGVGLDSAARHHTADEGQRVR